MIIKSEIIVRTLARVELLGIVISTVSTLVLMPDAGREPECRVSDFLASVPFNAS